MSTLEEATGYKFKNVSLLEEALTHPSMAYESKGNHADNQRMEFLGDAVIQLILTEHLYAIFPDFPEGQLTKLRARLVSRDALYQFATAMGLGGHLNIGKGEESNGGRTRPSTLADGFEALMGAIYLDGGLDAARASVHMVCGPWIEQLVQSPEEKNPKGQLQEELQALAPASPVYQTVESSGPDHQKVFKVTVEWQGAILGKGVGKSKKNAETQAAKDALEKRSWEDQLD